MAADHGDDVGEMLVRSIGRGAGRVITNQMSKYFSDKLNEFVSNRDKLEDEQSNTIPNGKLENPPEHEQACLPFGDKVDAAYFVQICRNHDIKMLSLADKEGNGYIHFFKEDVERIRKCIPEFSEFMRNLKNQEISNQLENFGDIDDNFLNGLEIFDIDNSIESDNQNKHPIDINKPSKEEVIHHVDNFKEKILYALDNCKNFADFERLLNERQIGIDTDAHGEKLFYEARLGEDGEILPYSHEQRDWSISATKLRDKYGLDATHDYFEKNFIKDEPKNSDGSLDNDGRTSDINQGIESHDGMDTDTQTLRLEREQNGTDIPPSVVRKQESLKNDDGRGYTIESLNMEMDNKHNRLANQGREEPDIDISDKFEQVR